MIHRRKQATADRKRAVIFDFDGTIADSFEYVLGFVQSDAGNHQVFNTAEKKVLRQMSMKRLILHLKVPIWKYPTMYFRGRRVMRQHMEDVQPFAGMVDVIRQLHADGCMLFISSSNSTHNIRHLLRRYDLQDCFTALRGSAGYTGKSSPIRQLLWRYRLPKQTTWYVGDETSDVVAATAAGIRCLAVSWGFADPDKLQEMGPAAFAQHPSDITAIVEASWKK